MLSKSHVTHTETVDYCITILTILTMLNSMTIMTLLTLFTISSGDLVVFGFLVNYFTILPIFDNGNHVDHKNNAGLVEHVDHVGWPC